VHEVLITDVCIFLSKDFMNVWNPANQERQQKTDRHNNQQYKHKLIDRRDRR